MLDSAVLQIECERLKKEVRYTRELCWEVLEAKWVLRAENEKLRQQLYRLELYLGEDKWKALMGDSTETTKEIK